MNHFKCLRGVLPIGWVWVWVVSVLFVLPAHVLAAQTIRAYIPNETPDSRYTLHNDGTVMDTKTGLMWKRCSEGQSNVGCTGTASTMTWKTALETAKNSTFAGHDDWRVPNIKELHSIVAYDRYSPSINATLFPNTIDNWYWSSSPNANNNRVAWVIHFSNGNKSGSFSRSIQLRVRLVRGGE